MMYCFMCIELVLPVTITSLDFERKKYITYIQYMYNTGAADSFRIKTEDASCGIPSHQTQENTNPV